MRKIFEETTGLRLEYKGEARPSLMLRAFETLFVNKRLKVPDATRDQILSTQDHKCGECGDGPQHYDLQHKKAVALGGTNDIENLLAVCKQCHAKLTADQQASFSDDTKSHTVASALCPMMHDVFTKYARPTQVAHKISGTSCPRKSSL